MCVVNDQSNGPGVRALVIGVGRYLHAQRWNLGDLSSATVSALEFALWLKDTLNYPNRPLKYLDVVISAARDLQESEEIMATKTSLSSEDVSWDYQTTTLDDIMQAIRAWQEQCNLSPEEVAIFYFCGHGIEHNGVIALLAENFEARDEDTEFFYTGSLDLRQFHQGTARFRAQNKYFFIDSCRSDPVELLGYEIRPNPVVSPQADRTHPGDAPIYLATKRGERAWGIPNQVSQFTSAIIRALNGAAGDRGRNDFEGQWVIKASELLKGIRTILLFDRSHEEDQEADIVEFPKENILHVPRQQAQIPVKVTWTSDWTSVFFSNFLTGEIVVESGDDNPLIIDALNIPNPICILRPCVIKDGQTIESHLFALENLEPPMLEYFFKDDKFPL